MVLTLPESPPSLARDGDRHTHIGIRLQFRSANQWERFEALGWNNVGFNFFHALDLPDQLELKRGLTRFDGQVVWRNRNTSDEVLLESLVNALIYKRASEMGSGSGLQVRLLKLIRVSAMVNEKRKILASLGLDIPDEQLNDMLERKRLENPMYHYGVKVESEAWSGVVKNALSISSVVVSLEKWSSALARENL